MTILNTFSCTRLCRCRQLFVVQYFMGTPLDCLMRVISANALCYMYIVYYIYIHIQTFILHDSQHEPKFMKNANQRYAFMRKRELQERVEKCGACDGAVVDHLKNARQPHDDDDSAQNALCRLAAKDVMFSYVISSLCSTRKANPLRCTWNARDQRSKSPHCHHANASQCSCRTGD